MSCGGILHWDWTEDIHDWTKDPQVYRCPDYLITVENG
jgi:hypothetical protein